MSIENRIHYKAIILYIIAGFATTVMILFASGLRAKVIAQKKLIENQYQSIILVNQIISSVENAQSFSAEYTSTRQKSSLIQFTESKQKVDSLITHLAAQSPYIDKAKFTAISSLLNKQSENITNLTKKFGKANPLDPLNKRLQNYHPRKAESINIIKVKKDTTIQSTHKKGFFVRLKEVFSPAENQTIVISSQRTDTLKLNNPDTLTIIDDINKISGKAKTDYQQNMEAIEFQVSELVNTNRQLSAQTTNLLLDIQQNMVQSMLQSISENEKTVNISYNISIIGGIFALIVILVFIIMIVYDVNKGKESREKITELMESRHQLLLSVSHDIKSPLMSILSYSKSEKSNKESTPIIQNAARYILSLLENLLEFSSLEQKIRTVTPSDFSLKTLCEDIGQIFTPLAEAKHLSFTYAAIDETVTSDIVKVKQIISNLVSNAIKYTTEGKVSLQVAYEDSEIRILVTDTGTGIPSDKIPELYKAYTRLEKNRGLASGNGLGLYVVKGLVDLLNGAININSIVNKGTEIKITIPANSTHITISKGIKKIKIIDDDPIITRISRDMLLQLGHQIVDENEDVILTDMEMGSITGLDILEKAQGIPVIVMTGRSDFSYNKAIELGFSNFLAKPFSITDLKLIFGEGENLSENDLWGDDREEIMNIFKEVSANNLTELENALKMEDYNKAQFICHRMLPTFSQFGYSIPELYRMDMNKGNEYEGWTKDVMAILTIKI